MHPSLLRSTQPELPNDIRSGLFLSDSRLYVQEMLGEGGQGSVFLAEHAITNEFRVVKFLSPQLSARSDMVRRFDREAKTLVMLKSAHICRVLDLGRVTLSGGRVVPYFVMDYLKGETLLAFLKRYRSIGVERLLVIGAQIATGLAVAHAKGVVHCDVKPGNIFLESLDPFGEVAKLIDFGISHNFGAESTAPGSVLGTAAFMPPEQWALAPEPASDVYSLGIVMWSLLAGGTHPFEPCETFAQMRQAHVDRGVPRILDYWPADQRRISHYQDLSEFLGQMTAMSPADRPTALACERVFRTIKDRAAADDRTIALSGSKDDTSPEDSAGWNHAMKVEHEGRIERREEERAARQVKELHAVAARREGRGHPLAGPVDTHDEGRRVPPDQSPAPARVDRGARTNTADVRPKSDTARIPLGEVLLPPPVPFGGTVPKRDVLAPELAVLHLAKASGDAGAVASAKEWAAHLGVKKTEAARDRQLLLGQAKRSAQAMMGLPGTASSETDETKESSLGPGLLVEPSGVRALYFAWIPVAALVAFALYVHFRDPQASAKAPSSPIATTAPVVLSASPMPSLSTLAADLPAPVPPAPSSALPTASAPSAVASAVSPKVAPRATPAEPSGPRPLSKSVKPRGESPKVGFP